MEPLIRLQELFRDLFQFDLADLDFGLYRLLHLKRGEVEAFLTEQLPRHVDEAFAEVIDEEHNRLANELADLANQVQTKIAEDAILPGGEIQPELLQSNIRFVRELADLYEATRQQIEALRVTEVQKADLFNHLYNFFSRYYDQGDFIPLHRYGTRETYAVPYSGEEIFFHWANRDQHYVKTAETFKDYAFRVSGLEGEYHVRFVLVEASVPKDNTKGNNRFFFPVPDLMTIDAPTLTLSFEYRLPTDEEIEQYGKNSKAQDAILETATPIILSAVSDENLRLLLNRDQRTERDIEENKLELPLLLKRMRHFCKRKTSDFFIHKNLRGFLQRELGFFVKDQLLHVMDIEGNLDAKRRMIRVFRKLALEVIDFLAQIEDAQRWLFEKRKFVLEASYLIPCQHIPPEFWSEILSNQSQKDEWVRWLALDRWEDLLKLTGDENEQALSRYPTLPLHTAHFDEDFVRRLLESLPFDDLDEVTDGLLVHGENYQALRLLQERYHEVIECIYIDPPYNTDASPIDYKNGYKSSTWTTLIDDRIRISRSFLKSDGVLVAAIDDEQHRELNFLLSSLFNNGLLGTICVRANPSGRPTKAGYSVAHEYLLFAGKSNASGIGRLPPTDEQMARFSQRDEEGVFEWRNLRREGSNSDRSARPALYYPIYIAETSIRVPKMTWNEDAEEWIVAERLRSDEQVVWPDNEAGDQKTWRWEGQTVTDRVADIAVRKDRSGRDYVYYKRRPHEEGVVSVSTWFDAKYSATEHGTALLKDLFGKSPFTYPKSINAVADSIYVAGASKENALTLDYFAGSGTTGHAVINLNREYSGRRRFILVEMGNYFDTTLVPRIAKVIFTSEWEDGKPKRLATPQESLYTPRLVKILRLESYEDALHNIATDTTLETASLREGAYKTVVGQDQFRLHYLLTLPLEEAETTLSMINLAHPFAYTLEILTDDGPIEKPVDVVETFNYLYGLRVQKYETWANPHDRHREYRAIKASDQEAQRRILVLWRDMADYDPEIERAFLEARIQEMTVDGEVWDEILINGDSPVPCVASLDPLFKRFMMEEEIV